MPAATMRIAGFEAGFNVQQISNSGGAASLKTQLDLWIAALRAPAAATPLDANNIANRTVLNWIPRGSELSASIDTALAAAFSQGVADQVANYVALTCEAVAEAQDSGRITTAQETAIRTSYNTIWP